MIASKNPAGGAWTTASRTCAAARRLVHLPTGPRDGQVMVNHTFTCDTGMPFHEGRLRQYCPRAPILDCTPQRDWTPPHGPGTGDVAFATPTRGGSHPPAPGDANVATAEIWAQVLITPSPDLIMRNATWQCSSERGELRGRTDRGHGLQIAGGLRSGRPQLVAPHGGFSGLAGPPHRPGGVVPARWSGAGPLGRQEAGSHPRRWWPAVLEWPCWRGERPSRAWLRPRPCRGGCFARSGDRRR
jgi:hypothetical protein